MLFIEFFFILVDDAASLFKIFDILFDILVKLIIIYDTVLKNWRSIILHWFYGLAMVLLLDLIELRGLEMIVEMA